ncbi:MAG: HdeD family acid-resistance protein [Candidatus Saccharimonadales bacterium]
MSTASVTKESWWALVLGGVATIIFGVAAVFWPGLTTLTLIYVFSAWVLAVGIADGLAGVASMSRSATWFLPAALSAFELGTGLYLLRHTAVKFSTMILLIGFVLIARGVVEAVNAYYANRTSARSKAISYFSGLVALVAGIVILFSKQANGISFVWLLGVYGLVVGILSINELSEGAK